MGCRTLSQLLLFESGSNSIQSPFNSILIYGIGMGRDHRSGSYMKTNYAGRFVQA
jgi:hypothetical protein